MLVRILLAVGLLLGAAGCSGDSEITDPDNDSDPNSDTYPYPVGKVFFSHPPVGLDNVIFFESMGAMFSPYQQDHGGFHHPETDISIPTTIPVIAPADGQITELRTHESHTPNYEYAIRLKVSTTITLLWGHVGRLSDRLAAQASSTIGSRDVRIPVEAGEIIGYVAHTALDLAVNDSLAQTKVLYPEFYGPNAYSMPLEDYYREPLRSQIRDLTLRQIEPRTGRYGFDVGGTLAGLWYIEGSDPRPEYREDIAYHFGYHHLLADRSTIVDGEAWVNRNTGPGDVSLWSFWIKGNPRMEDITPASGVVMLEMYPARSGFSGIWPDVTLQDDAELDDITSTWSILLVEMLDSDSIRLERFDAPTFDGISPDDVNGFTSNAKTYHRNPLRP